MNANAEWEPTDVPDEMVAGDEDIVRNEFANVMVAVRRDGNGPVLELIDRRSGHRRVLDSLMLESLILVDTSLLETLLDPSSVAAWR